MERKREVKRMRESNIEAIDFELLYALQKRSSSVNKSKKAEDWDKKAWEMNVNIHEGYYNDFMESRVNLSDAETILDVGCGPGTFALRFAPRVKHAYAFDFSPTMLEVLAHNAKERGIGNITSFCVNLEEEWSGVPLCDVVIASRCLEVENIGAVLDRLNAHAKKRVYLTFKVGRSFLSDEILEVLGREIIPKPDYIYLLNILYQKGINASVEFIDPGNDGYKMASLEEYLYSLTWAQNGLTPEEESRARDYFLACQSAGKTPAHRNNRWALISWEK